MDSILIRLQGAIDGAIRGMTAEQLAWHPEEKWSAAEVLEHLYLTYTGTAKNFERCLAAGKPTASSPTFKQRISALLIVGLGYMPEGRKAGPHVTPKGISAETLRNEIESKIAIMDSLISQCEQEYGRSVPLADHPILGPLTGRQWRRFHWVHGRHHLQQILRLRKASGGSA